LPQVVIVGHLTDLKSIRRTFGLVAKFYGATILTPDDGGSATAIGALLSTEQLLQTGA
jgi:type II pantothenate kinase